MAASPRTRVPRRGALGVALAILLASSVVSAGTADAPDWGAVRGVLEARCLECHGAEKDDMMAWHHEGTYVTSVVTPNHCAECHRREAVEFGSFGNMRSMESSDALKSGRLRARDSSDAESFKTRRGVVGGYVDYLEPEQIQWMEERLRRDLHPSFGYSEPRTAS